MKTVLMDYILNNGVSYNATYQAILDKADTEGATLPNAAIQAKDNTFWGGLADDGNLSLMDTAYLLGSSGSEEYCMINGADPDSFYLTKNGTITWTAENGSAGNGTDGYYSTGWNPSSGPNFTQNSNAFGLYTKVNLLTASKTDMGVWLIASSGQGAYLSARNTSDVYRTQNNNGSGASSGTVTDSTGLTSVVRVVNTEYKVYKNGSDDATLTATSSSVVSLVWNICAYQGNTVPGGFSTRQIAFAYTGSGAIDQLEVYNRLVTRFS